MKAMMNSPRNPESVVIFTKISAFLYAEVDDEEKNIDIELEVTINKGDNGTSGSELSRIPRNYPTAILLEEDYQTEKVSKQGNICDSSSYVCIKGSSNVLRTEKSLINVPVISDNALEFSVPYVVVLKKKRKPPDNACI